MVPRAMQLTDWLDDLSVRFIVNLPREELESVERICFQVEEAQWFYEDFVRPLDPNLPSLNLRQFSMKIFQHCPLFSGYGADVHSEAFSEFLAYKTRVPVRGAILLNETMDQVILVKGWKKGANWSFPRGKINKDEKDIDCAIREVYEETGFDINAAGLNTGEDNAKFIEVTMREQHMKLFVFAGIPMDTYFEPRTRKEISAIQWYKLSELPTLRKVKQQQENAAPHVNNNKFYMVAPFVKPLKRIISQLRREGPNVVQGSYFPDSTMLEQSIPEQAPVPQMIAPLMTGNDMNRLMTQLRQSSQASRESNYPEVSDPSELAHDGSQQLMGMLNPAMGQQQAEQQAATVRESKANAMLSLLRSGSGSSLPTPARSLQTPVDQVHGQPTHPPPSPQPRSARTPQMVNRPAPPMFEVSPDQPEHYQARPPMDHSIQVSPQEQQAMLPPFLRDPPRGQYGPPTSAPYRRTGDPQFAASQAPGGVTVPHASKLPPPKLNAHSSSLLNLFKTAQPAAPESGPSQPTARPELALTQPISRPELSAFSPVVHRPAHPVGMPPPMFSSTPALATPGSETPQDGLKRSSQQETLLGLFRLAKPSPSLAPPLDPVELSAQGSPTHQRVASDQLRLDRPILGPSGDGPFVIVKNPERTLSGRVSATVSGPLHVPQFEILQRPAEPKDNGAPKPKAQPAAAPATMPQHPIKILSRPHAALPPTPEPTAARQVSPQPARSPRRTHHKSRASSKELPFQPQILKRPTSSSQPEPVVPSPRSVPAPTVPPKLPLHPSERRPPVHASPIGAAPNQAQEHKATLLSLFGTGNSTPTSTPNRPIGLNITSANAGPGPALAGAPILPHGAMHAEPRRGSMVSPLSEKPTSGLSSPLRTSRVGSLQEMDGGPAAGPARVETVPEYGTSIEGKMAVEPDSGKMPLSASGKMPLSASGKMPFLEAGKMPFLEAGKMSFPPPPLGRAAGTAPLAVQTQGMGAARPPGPSRARSGESSGVQSPVERQFLLGFLDSVASQGGK